MSKKIVNFESDVCVYLIKTFRNVNLQAGICKKKNDIEGFEKNCRHLIALANKALEYHFHIWVNENGQTGHDYQKDYKVTLDSLNDFQGHVKNIKKHIESDIIQSIYSMQRETNN
jgi:hypothetical protein